MRCKQAHKKRSAAEIKTREEKAARCRALHASYVARVQAQALIIRQAAAELMLIEGEIAEQKEKILEKEIGKGEFEPVGFEPHGDMDYQKEFLDDPICPGFQDIHSTMEELVKHCERVLAAPHLEEGVYSPWRDSLRRSSSSDEEKEEAR